MHSFLNHVKMVLPIVWHPSTEKSCFQHCWNTLAEMEQHNYHKTYHLEIRRTANTPHSLVQTIIRSHCAELKSYPVPSVKFLIWPLGSLWFFFLKKHSHLFSVTLGFPWATHVHQHLWTYWVSPKEYDLLGARTFHSPLPTRIQGSPLLKGWGPLTPFEKISLDGKMRILI